MLRVSGRRIVSAPSNSVGDTGHNDPVRHQTLPNGSAIHRPERFQAFINAIVVSSMRFEKPHSLSYQDNTLTNVPPMTFVSVES